MPREPTRAPKVANSPPVIDEVTLTDLPVSGTLPSAVSGQYLCIGTNRIDAQSLSDDGAAGDAMVHAVSLHAGRAVSYRNRWITIGPDVPATSLVTFGRSIYAVGDGALACELSAGLDTLRSVDLAGARRRLVAHPKVDRFNGELHFLTVAVGLAQLLVRVSPGGLTRSIRSIGNAPNPVRELELTHDDVVLLADGFIGVIGRGTASTEATWFEADTDALHIATADAHDETVVVCTTGPSLVRWVLHPHAGTVDCEVLDAMPQSAVTGNRQLQGGARRYLWTIGAGSAHKHDLSAGTRRSHEFAGSRRPGALVFITDPDRSTTDDGGWLVGFVHDETTNETDFVVLDAQTIERNPIATVHIPGRVHASTNGTWIPAVQI